MTRFSTVRLVAVVGALATSAALLTPTASQAQGPAAYYTAVPEAKPSKTSFLTRETVWTWRDTGYVARRGGDRDAIQCQLVAKQAGKLSAFSAGGTAFDAAALEKCNTKAR